jgi:hypothetical protein
MEKDLFDIVKTFDLKSLSEALFANPGLANEGVALPGNDRKGHPLHRICDAVFVGRITDELAVEMAKILLEYGSDIDGFMSKGDNNTPLIAAASLHAEKLGIFYIEHGANIHYAPKSDGGTALHWAAYCGRDKLVERLIRAGANINQLDTAYHSTPLGWAEHALSNAEKNDVNSYHQKECIMLLLRAGTDKSLLAKETIQYLKQLFAADSEIMALLQ